MQSDIVYIIYFCLGILFQIYFFISRDFKKEDIKKLIKSIFEGLVGALIPLIAIGNYIEEISLSLLPFIMAYILFICFGAAFALNFKQKISPRLNQISLLILNTIFLYYITTRLGYTHFFAIFFYIPTIIALILLLFKTELKKSSKGFLCIWYLILLIFTGFINLYYILSAPKNHFYSSYLSTLLAGSVAFNIYVYIVYLIAFVPVSKRDKDEIIKRRAEVKDHFLLLISSFQKIKINPFLFFLTFVLLNIVLVLNFHNKYISENLFIVSLIFLTAYLNEKLSKPIILSTNN